MTHKGNCTWTGCRAQIYGAVELLYNCNRFRLDWPRQMVLVDSVVSAIVRDRAANDSMYLGHERCRVRYPVM